MLVLYTYLRKDICEHEDYLALQQYQHLSKTVRARCVPLTMISDLPLQYHFILNWWVYGRPFVISLLPYHSTVTCVSRHSTGFRLHAGKGGEGRNGSSQCLSRGTDSAAAQRPIGGDKWYLAILLAPNAYDDAIKET